LPLDVMKTECFKVCLANGVWVTMTGFKGRRQHALFPCHTQLFTHTLLKLDTILSFVFSCSCLSLDHHNASSPSSALQPWVSLCLHMQVSPVPAILGFRPPISTIHFPCVLYGLVCENIICEIINY